MFGSVVSCSLSGVALIRIIEQEKKMITTVLFDLDGTLLPMDNDAFTKGYFKLLAGKMTAHGYDPEELVDAIWKSTYAMVKNNGNKTNEEVFWENFSNILGKDTLTDKPLFDEFYNNEFGIAKKYCGYNPQAKEVIDYIKSKDLRIILASNPLFPKNAQENRVKWAGLTPEDFSYYTSYKNSHFCKPNPKYYQEILTVIKCKPEECLMIGNNVDEDMIASKLGINVFLLTDCLINESKKDINKYSHGGFSELKSHIKENLKMHC